MTPNRVAAVLAAVGALCAGLAPAVANLDVSSTAGLIAGVLGVVAVVRKWLDGWQKHEQRVFDADPAAVLQTVAHRKRRPRQRPE